MKIAVTGASGFIASRFIKLYGENFKEIITLSSKNAPLHDYEKINKQLSGVDVLVHTAFDHYYQSNIQGLDNIIQACKENNIKKIVFLSTVSVYDPDIQGDLTESSDYSSYNDPYSQEKIKLENMLKKIDDMEVIILQPTIVYGIGGAWSNYIFSACKNKKVNLPFQGKMICNAVYVDDVAQAIFKAIMVKNISFGKFLISGNEKINWDDLYNLHHRILIENYFLSNLNIGLIANNNEFHSNIFLNIIFYLWFKTKFSFFFNFFIKFIKKMREKKYVHKKMSKLEFLNSDLSDNEVEPLGMTRKVHQSNFNVIIEQAQKELNYEPFFDLEKAKQKIMEQIEEDKT